jgi:hypothetical protein
MTECWIKIFAVTPWVDANVWVEFHSKAEEILSAKLTNLDTNDPPRRKIKRAEFKLTGIFTTDFGIDDQVRWIFGRYKDVKVEMTLQHYKTLRSGIFDFPNSLTLYFPDGFSESEKGLEKIEHMFNLGNKLLNPFYSFADLQYIITKKRKPYGAVNIQEELLGIFWLTFFNNKYIEYFGHDKLAQMPNAFFGSHGFTLKLSKGPNYSSEFERKQLENILGSASFVDPKEPVSKPIGQSVLSFEQLNL